MFPIHKEEYPLLHLFKHQIESDKMGHFYRPYSFHKPSVYLYRLIFLGIGALYSLLAFILLIKTLSWTSEFLFGSKFYVKTTLLGICGLIGTSSLLMSFSMRPEKEAVKKAIRKGKTKLKRAYVRKKIQHGLNVLFSFGELRHKALAFNHHFHEMMAKLYEEQEEAYHLVDRISRTKSVDYATREELFNQAIIELHRKIEGLVHYFERSTPGKI